MGANCDITRLGAGSSGSAGPGGLFHGVYAASITHRRYVVKEGLVVFLYKIVLFDGIRRLDWYRTLGFSAFRSVFF